MSQGVDQRPGSTRRRKRRPGPIALRVPSDVRLRVTADDFWRLCVANRELRLERTAKGILIVMAPAGSETGMRNGDLIGQVYVWAKANGTGVTFDSSAGFTLPNGAVRAPDVAWIVRERWDAIAPERRKKFAPICPDFAAELMSPSDRVSTVREKMVEYIGQGVRLAWLIDPMTSEVEIHRPGREVETLTKPATLSGEDVLPGFVLDLKGILFD